jgi:RNA-directed DNA polymerase
MATLPAAYRLAQAHHGAPGSDGVTGADIEASGVDPFRERRRDALVARTYQPRRGRRKEIPQDGGTQVRGLGIPTRRDRGVPGALTRLLEPIFAADVQPGA